MGKIEGHPVTTVHLTQRGFLDVLRANKSVDVFHEAVSSGKIIDNGYVRGRHAYRALIGPQETIEQILGAQSDVRKEVRVFMDDPVTVLKQEEGKQEKGTISQFIKLRDAGIIYHGGYIDEQGPHSIIVSSEET